MNVHNTPYEFGLISKLLHWSIAVIMIGLIPLGWYLVGLSDESVLYWRLFDLHLVIGLVLFVLVPFKFVWQYVSHKPKPTYSLTVWERHAARAVHSFFLVAMALIPLSGLLFVASNGEPINLYELIVIPDLGQYSKGVRETLSNIHYYLSYVCAALIVVHVLAAFKHQYFDINKSLRRMTL